MTTTYRVSHKVGDDATVRRVASDVSTTAKAAAAARAAVAAQGGVAYIIDNVTDSVVGEVRA
jgi:hypothetical protein